MLTRMPRTDGTGRYRNIIMLVASIALHVLVLTPLALRWISDAPYKPSEQSHPPILLQIEPRPLVDRERPRPRPVMTDDAITVPDDLTAQSIVQTPIARTPEEQEKDAPPTRPVPQRPGAPRLRGPASPTTPDRWQVRPNDTGGRVAQSLRNGPVGCRMIETLTAAERAACDQTFGQAASEAAPIEGTGNAGRDGRFAREGAAALARYEARRAPGPGGVGVTGISGDCAGGNLRGNCPGELLRDGFRHEEDRVRQPRLPN